MRFIPHPSSLIPFLLLALSCHSESARTIKDDVGRHVAVPAHPARVISLAPNITEIIYAIGGERVLIATDDNSDTPAAVKRLPKVGGMQPNIEKIAALK